MNAKTALGVTILGGLAVAVVAHFTIKPAPPPPPSLQGVTEATLAQELVQYQHVDASTATAVAHALLTETNPDNLDALAMRLPQSTSQVVIGMLHARASILRGTQVAGTVFHEVPTGRIGAYGLPVYRPVWTRA